MLCSVFADGSLNIRDGDILTFDIEFSQSLQRLRKGLVVEAEVAVAGRTTLVGDGLADGTEVMLHVFLYELEDRLADTSLSGVIHTGRHGWSTTGISLAVESVIRDTIDGTG